LFAEGSEFTPHVARAVLVLLCRSRLSGRGIQLELSDVFRYDHHRVFRALGYDQQADAKKTGVDFHVVKSLVEYKAPVRFDEEIEVGARVARIGNSSLVFELTIFLKDRIDALVTGEIVWVYTSQQTHRPVPIPESIRAIIAARELHLA
jgi:acyl-CoA thioester hydrolase